MSSFNGDWIGSLMHPKLLDGLNYESKGENNRRKSWGMLFNLQHFEGRNGVLEFWDQD